MNGIDAARSAWARALSARIDAQFMSLLLISSITTSAGAPTVAAEYCRVHHIVARAGRALVGCYVGAVSRPIVADVNSLRALRRARDRIDRDYADQLEIAALAADAGYSLGQFIRAFDAAYGETPGRYRTRRRVERACELLRSVNLTVTEICMLVGFSSLGSFSRRFADIVGQPPVRRHRGTVTV